MSDFNYEAVKLVCVKNSDDLPFVLLTLAYF